MRNDLFIDSVNALASGLEAKVFHILTRSRKVSDKMENLTIELLHFKCTLLENIAAFITPQRNTTPNKNEALTAQTLERLREEITANQDRLCRYRLHHILKQKADRQRRESMLASSLSVHQDAPASELEKSILLIEKDLGIEPDQDENQKLALTRVINRSLFLGIDSSPASAINPNDCSAISEPPSLHFPTLPSPNDPAHDLSQDLSRSITNQNQQENGKQFESEQKIPPKKPNPLKKKKTNLVKSDVREGLLGNLLEETYNQCLDKK